mmetsp:Transcript_3460/g.7517  ORF Transcript_3460/g.7517 Transcript_3460/m.7517 type:complete len:206 (-) Transcript_3460:305-922(-)
MGLGRTVSGRHTAKAMSFHCALKTLALANAANIYILTGNEVSSVNLRSRLRHGIFRGYSKLSYNVRRTLTDAKLLKGRHKRSVNILGLALAGTKNDGIVPVWTVRGLVPQDDVGIEMKDGAGMTLPPAIPNRHHAELDTERAASPVAQSPRRLSAKLGLKVLQPVRHLQRTLALSGLPIGVLLGPCLGFHGCQFVIEQCIDFSFG